MADSSVWSFVTGWDFSQQPDIYGHATWEWSVADHKVYFSPGWRRILQAGDDTVRGPATEGWWPRVHDDDVNPFLEAARDIVEGRTEDYQTLFRMQRNDGAWAWVLSRGRVTERHGGVPVRVSGVLMDVTFLRADVKFQHGGGPEEPHEHAMLENSPDVIVRLDQELIPLYVNPQISRYMIRRVESGSWQGSGEDDERQQAFLREKVAQVFADGVAVREELSFATAYGHDVVGEYSFWPEFDGTGKIVSVMMQFRDLTEKVLAEQKAMLNEMRLEALNRLSQMGNSPEEDVLRFAMDSLIRITGSESGLLFFPQAFPGLEGRVVWSREHYEYLPSDDLREDMLPEEILPPEMRNNPAALRIMRNGNNLQPVKIDFGGRLKVLRFIMAPVMDGDRVVCIGAVCNKAREYKEADLQQLEAFCSGAWLILRGHEIMRELHRAKEAAELASRAKSEFLANVSHELRTPLNGVLSMMELLDNPDLTAEQRKFLDIAMGSGRSLLEIVSDILDISRLESGKMSLRSELFDLKQVLESSLYAFKRQADQKGLAFHLDVDPGIPRFLEGDAPRVRQVLYNLVGNAFKFTEKGEIRVTCSLLSRNVRNKARMYFCVSDTGIGVPEDQLVTVFEAFTQVDSSSTRRYSGSGLGLSIVSRLVHLMSGDVSIESVHGKGTSVHCSLLFSLPGECEDAAGAETARDREPPVPPRPEKQPGERAAVPPLVFLVVDDDSVSRFALEAFLRRAGHQAVGVESGPQALEALAAYPFDCLMTDIQMPVMDGIMLLRRVRAGAFGNNGVLSAAVAKRLAGLEPGDQRASSRHIPCVAVSAHAMRGDRERFLEAGFDGYLAKPVSLDELRDSIAHVAALSRRP